MQEMQVQVLDQEDALEEKMATYSTVFLPGKSHGQRSLVGYSPQSGKESDMTEHTCRHIKELVRSEQMGVFFFFFLNYNSIHYIDHLRKKWHLYALDFSFEKKFVIL